jgi:hypothetical protein
MLGQLNQAHPASSPAPSSSGASDLLKELQMNTSPGGSRLPSSDASTLLDQLAPPAKPSSEASHASQQQLSQEHVPSDRKVADLLADFGGERPNQE